MDEDDCKMTEYEEAIVGVGEEIAALVINKNRAYGDSTTVVSNIMKILYPKGVPFDKIDDMLIIVRDMDKTVRLAIGDKRSFGESPWIDKCGYALLAGTKESLANIQSTPKGKRKEAGFLR